MHKRKFAAIDIGTNTFRLLIAEVLPGPTQKNYSLREICSLRIITRLGEGIADDGLISQEAMDRGIDALSEFHYVIQLNKVQKVSAVATSALRDAENRSDFLDRAKKETGLEIMVITGEHEARITAMGMLMDMQVTDNAFLLDIGGGSTELIMYGDGNTHLIRSLQLGVVHLAERYMRHDPPLAGDLIKMEEEISAIIAKEIDLFCPLLCEDTLCAGTAGTVTALAAISQRLDRFQHEKIHHYRLHRDQVEQVFLTISKISSQERARHIPFELSRLDIIVPGTLILLTLMQAFGFCEITVSNYGLREGILIEQYREACQRAEHKN